MSTVDVRSIEREALDLTRELCRKPSVSAEERALDETAELVETLLTATGFETRQLEVDGAPPAVYGELAGEGDASLLLYNHYDVQPVDPIELWESPPFASPSGWSASLRRSSHWRRRACRLWPRCNGMSASPA